MIQTRCSALPLTMACAASTVQDGPRVSGDAYAADLGTAAHFVLLARIEGRDVDSSLIAMLHGVELEELERMVAWGWNAWQKVRHLFPEPTCEVPLHYAEDGLTLTGHADVVSIVEREGRILDLKTGRLDADHSQQLAGYGLLLTAANEIDSVYCMTIRVREQQAEGYRWTREELSAWWDGLTEHLKDRDTFRPGRHCQYCPRGVTCPAKTALLRQHCGALLEQPEEFTLPADPLIIGQLFDRAKLVTRAAETIIDLVRAEVANRGGRIPIGDGRELVQLEQERRSIDYRLGRDILESALGPDGLEKCTNHTINKSKVESEVKALAPARQNGKAVAALMDDLDRMGAIKTATIQRLEVRRNNVATSTAAIEHEPKPVGSSPF